MKILSFNVRGLGSGAKRSAVGESLENEEIRYGVADLANTDQDKTELLTEPVQSSK